MLLYLISIYHILPVFGNGLMRLSDIFLFKITVSMLLLSFTSIVDLTFRITTCRSLLAIAFRT